MKKLIIMLLLLFPGMFFSQVKQPKLIVGIVVDQMKDQYLDRYRSNFIEGGFNRLLNDGYRCKNNQLSYIPTYTGPGHASIYTGTTPSMHGVIANNFYDKFLGEVVYCAYDSTVMQTQGDKVEGQMSAARILTTTIGDELKNAYPNAKVISVSEKDRASTFPAGHNADGAYWLTGKKFITSTAYKEKVPKWVKKFNKKELVSKYLSQKWELLLPKDKYITKLDYTTYEGLFEGEKRPVFPHDLPAIYASEEKASLIKKTPFGNSITVDMTIAAIENESLGVDDNMDLLCVSFSSTDYVGHRYGTYALETEDTYYRLDKDLERLFTYLDEKVGKGQYTVFLASDHGAADPPGFLEEQNIVGGFFDYEPMHHELDSLLDMRFGEGDWILNLTGNYIFLNQELMEKNKLDKMIVYRWIKDYLLVYPGIYQAYDRISLMENSYNDWLGSRVKNGFNARYSPDIIYLTQPGFISASYKSGGTTHGGGYTYDTHTPLLWMGYGISPGIGMKATANIDIVPTLCTMFNIPLPSGCTGSPIEMK